MATIYEDFGAFMNGVIKKADERCIREYNVQLEQLFTESLLVKGRLDTIMSLLDNGWPIFLAVVALFTIGSVGFFSTIGIFLATPVGIVVAVALGVTVITLIKDLYTNRKLPIMIADIGKRYKPEFDKLRGNHAKIDVLQIEVANKLFEEAAKNAKPFT